MTQTKIAYMKEYRRLNKKEISAWRRARYLKHRDQEALTHRAWIQRNPEYTTWLDMKSRCANPKATSWKYYGAVCVTVCPRWRKSFKAFITDMGARPANKSLDRINPYGNYEPSNCRWATNKEQGTNKRKVR